MGKTDTSHGGKDGGASANGIIEKNMTLDISKYMYDRFKELGVPVVSTRTDDRTLTREQRLNTMRSLGTDSQVIILANHINSGGERFSYQC